VIESELFGYEGAFSSASATGKKAGGAGGEDAVPGRGGRLEHGGAGKLLRFLEEEFSGGRDKSIVRTQVVSATYKDLGTLTKGSSRDLSTTGSRCESAGAFAQRTPGRHRPDGAVFPPGVRRKFGKEFTGISPEAEAALKAYRWKGNVRELKNLVERGALLGKGTELTLRELGVEISGAAENGNKDKDRTPFPAFPPEGIDLVLVQEAMEKHFIEEALKRAGGNESQAAKLLNLNHHTFRYRRKKLEL
jgi:DNA-binding NtrC family response regulator